MLKEFEGKNEKEAISKAMETLNLSSDEFEIEILPDDGKKFGFFKKNNVRIRVYVNGEQDQQVSSNSRHTRGISTTYDVSLINKGVEFVQKTIQLMGYSGTVQVEHREDNKIIFNIDSNDSAILIGKQGKNLDALQLVLNVYLSSIGTDGSDVILPRVILDSQDYRQRREETIVRNALKSADQVVRNKSSRLLDPMPAFERRLIHTALSERHDIITQSEGEGSARQVRIIYKGSR